MGVPEIPARDVAKLVLGYLAEEQLMTAYDEFLATSPYLDAMDNEYDRIFMTSIKRIAAEYRALRICVENVHPVILRKELMQLPNSIEMFEYLVKQLNLMTLILNSNGLLPPNSHFSLRDNENDKSRHKKKFKDSKRDVCLKQIPTCMQSSHHANNVETTSPADLPGNNTKTKKKMRVLEKNTTAVSPFNLARERELERLETQSLAPVEQNKSHLDGSVQNACSLSLRAHNKLESRLCSEHNSSTAAGGSSQNANPEPMTAGTFQEFASGVAAGTQVIENIPDSSTTEHVNSVKSVETKPQTAPIYPQQTVKGKKSQYLIQLATPNTLVSNQRINIISNVKVDDSCKFKGAFPIATSTPGVKSIVVNGKPTQNQSQTYTKEEIMAMPTLILVPTSGPPPAVPPQPTSFQPPPAVAPQPMMIQPLCGAGDVSASSAGTLGPLTIDVAADSPAGPAGPAPPPVTCDVKNIVQSSVPKDSVVSIVGNTSTPQVLPPTRKSSSTPRRTSHIRVLDFATPRRIIEGTIQEQQEILLSRSPSLNENDGKPKEDDAAKENKPIPQTSKSKNWDADLRALVGTPQVDTKTPKPKPKSKLRCVRKKKTPETETPKTDKKKSAKKTLTLKASAKKSKRKSEEHSHESIKELVGDVVVAPEVPIKPTINIITKWTASPPKEDKTAKTSDNKSSEMQSDTPETDHLSLQNAIGAKLNISDLLQTPYKQALYDIQMDTPAFLRPDIPCSEPVSEIKITDIPTPRFMNTPGSRDSRPTDYSSGGSYYRPDDDALLPPGLDLEPRADLETPAAPGPAPPAPTDPTAPDTPDTRSHRPQRKCAQNVSYCDSKAKTIETKDDHNSSIDTTIIDVTGESDVDSKSNSSAVKDTKTKTKESNRKTVRNRRPSKKGTPNKFMKIKPRRPTPVKLNRSKSRKDSAKSQNTTSKRTSSKEKPVTPAPTKSRRKSSTPRKLHTKVFSTDSLDTNSSESINRGKEMNKLTAPSVDSDTETVRLRWPDDNSRASGANNSANDIEDINKIQQFIESTGNNVCPTPLAAEDESSSLHIDLVKRGFDSDTARRIERDLLDAGPVNSPRVTASANSAPFYDISIPSGTVANTAENDVGTSETNDNSKNEEPEYRSVQECNEESSNYFVCKHDDQKEQSNCEPVRMKDGYSVEICIDDEVIRIQATPYTDLLDEEPYLNSSSYVETEAAVSSIANIDRLYSPLKDRRTMIQEQCIEIFDSTLTSLDTPLKANSPKRKDVSISELIEITIEKEDPKDKGPKKRKRAQSSPEVVMENKKNKKEPRFIPDIQNIDIESVLSKLHP